LTKKPPARLRPNEAKFEMKCGLSQEHHKFFENQVAALLRQNRFFKIQQFYQIYYRFIFTEESAEQFE